MAFAQGTCPNCGAPLEFAIGSTISKVCEYCRHTVVRSDRGFAHLGKVADLAPTSALVAIGDEGTLGGRPIRILGRVQLDYGNGVWDEYYVAFDHGQAWGWLAYAQGRWHTTVPVPSSPVPQFHELAPEHDVLLGQAGRFRVAEVRAARIVSAEGELPGTFPVGFERHYADVHGVNSAFGTIDYGDRRAPPALFLGWIFPESALQIVQLGPRSAQKIKTTSLRCPSCGGDVPALTGGRAERLGCQYCGAVSDIAESKVIAQQELAREKALIPLGSRGTLGGVEYVCTALVRRMSTFEGERFEWDEFLLYGGGAGYAWLVRDPETGWSKVHAINLAELDLREMPAAVSLQDRRYRARNDNTATVVYVVGEVYWKCAVGETTDVADYEHGGDVLSREASPGEVQWSFSKPVPWPVVAHAFGLPVNAPGGRVVTSSSASTPAWVPTVFCLLLLALPIIWSWGWSRWNESQGASVSGGVVSTGTYRGGGIFSGGK
jgi:hypothetical protein